MPRIILVHGAFNELWGPNELKARWLPALRDGLWHHGVRIEDSDVDVCFYGDLFRRAPGTDADAQLEKSRAGFAEVLTELVKTHSNFKGEVPALDQKAWREWWAANSAGITFAR